MDLGGATCATAGYNGGTLSCDSACSFDTSSCTGRCGDGVKSGSDQCDGTDLGGATCATAGYHGGTQAGQRYDVVVDGFGSNTGNFQLQVTCP